MVKRATMKMLMWKTRLRASMAILGSSKSSSKWGSVDVKKRWMPAPNLNLMECARCF